MSTQFQGARPAELAGRALLFARETLGPASGRLLADPGQQALVLSHLRAGRALEDAVLTAVHRGARADRELRNELLGSLLPAVLGGGGAAGADASAALQGYVETGDLAEALLGERWDELAGARFDSLSLIHI